MVANKMFLKNYGDMHHFSGRTTRAHGPPSAVFRSGLIPKMKNLQFYILSL